MPGIRLYPSYHNYTLQKPEVARLLKQAGKRGLLVQLAVRMEDPRVHLPVTRTPAVDVEPLPDLLAAVPGVKIQLLNAFNGTQPLRRRERTAADRTDPGRSSTSPTSRGKPGSVSSSPGTAMPAGRRCPWIA